MSITQLIFQKFRNIPTTYAVTVRIKPTKMSVITPHYNERSKYTNRNMESVYIHYYFIKSSTMRCWKGPSLNQLLLQLWQNEITLNA